MAGSYRRTSPDPPLSIVDVAVHSPPSRPGTHVPAVWSERGRVSPSRRLRRVLVCAALIGLVAAAASYATSMLGPSNSSLGIRSVEWLRDHGAAGLVSKVENLYYSLNAPAKGGPALRALPRVGVAAGLAGTHRVPSASLPPRIRALALPALPGEGVWHPTRATASRTDPPLLVSTFRDEPLEYPRLVAGVAWINTARTTVALYAGRQEPSVSLPSRGEMEIPHGLRGRLLANLNDGPEWGATLGNAIRVWRSGIGVDRHGNLIYAAANDQTVGSLAHALIHAGAVRAMELDINSYWVSFITYSAPGALGASNLLSGMERPPQRYLTADDRDFFAVYER
jgi:hypothetical protein